MKEIATAMMLVADAIEILNNSDDEGESEQFYTEAAQRMRDLSCIFHAPGEPEEGWEAPVVSLDAHRAKKDLMA